MNITESISQYLQQGITRELNCLIKGFNWATSACVGRDVVGVTCSVPWNRKATGSNLPQPWTSCSPIIVCEEGNGKPPHSSHAQVA